MKKSIRLAMFLMLCATGIVVTTGFAAEGGKGSGLTAPLIDQTDIEMGPMASGANVDGGDEKKLGGVVLGDAATVDISKLAASLAAAHSSASSSASSSTKSSPAKSEDGLVSVNDQKKAASFVERLKKWFVSLTDKQKEYLGYCGVTSLAAFNEVYSRFVNSAYGFPLALFIGQLGAIAAKDEPYKYKFSGGMGIGLGVSLLEIILFLAGGPRIDLFIPASAAGFVLYSAILDLMKKAGPSEATLEKHDEVADG